MIYSLPVFLNVLEPWCYGTFLNDIICTLKSEAAAPITSWWRYIGTFVPISLFPLLRNLKPEIRRVLKRIPFIPSRNPISWKVIFYCQKRRGILQFGHVPILGRVCVHARVAYVNDASLHTRTHMKIVMRVKTAQCAATAGTPFSHLV